MKRKAPSDEVPQDKRRKVISKRYPGLRAPPQRKLMPKAFSTTVMVGSSKFETLPPEIRNTIYDLVLVDNDVPLQVRHKHYFDRGMTVHALTQVSRSIRAETLQMYYSANTFRFHSLLDLEMFLGTAGDDSRFLKKIELDEGVIEGRNYSSWKRKDVVGPRPTLTTFTYRITKEKPAAFETSDPIHPETKQSGLHRLKHVTTKMANVTEDELIIEGPISHCPVCATGSKWRCKFDSWWEK